MTESITRIRGTGLPARVPSELCFHSFGFGPLSFSLLPLDPFVFAVSFRLSLFPAIRLPPTLPHTSLPPPTDPHPTSPSTFFELVPVYTHHPRSSFISYNFLPFSVAGSGELRAFLPCSSCLPPSLSCPLRPVPFSPVSNGRDARAWSGADANVPAYYVIRITIIVSELSTAHQSE